MENASKALLIAAGVLISLVVISLLLVMFNRLGYFKQSKSSSEQDSQIIAFNNEFEKYATADTIRGIDFITLTNKVIDYKNGTGTLKYIDYNTDITIVLKNIKNYTDKHILNYNKFFGNALKGDNLIIDGSKNTNFVENIIYSRNLEEANTLRVMTAVKSISSFEDFKSSKYGYIYGTDNGKIRNEDDFKIYKDYSEFKGVELKLSEEPEYNKNRQITKIVFECK